MIITTTEPSANNLRAIWFRCSLWLFAWKLELSRGVELMPTRETQGNESAMNLRGRQRSAAYSPKCVEGVGSCELRHNGVLRSSRQTWSGGIMLVAVRDASPRRQRGNPRPMQTRGGWHHDAL